MEVYIKKLLSECTLKNIRDCLVECVAYFALMVFLSALPAMGIRNLINEMSGKKAVSTIKCFPYSSGEDKETIAKNAEILQGLSRDKWERLTLQQKLNIMQTVANIEAQHLRIPYRVRVIALAGLPEDLFAYYDYEKHRIVMNIDSLGFDPSVISLTSVCHEMRHCHQHVKADEYDALSPLDKEIYQYEPEAVIAREFKNYKLYSPEDDDQGYYTQLCEIEARIYAGYAVTDYLDVISQKPEIILY